MLVAQREGGVDGHRDKGLLSKDSQRYLPLLTFTLKHSYMNISFNLHALVTVLILVVVLGYVGLLLFL